MRKPRDNNACYCSFKLECKGYCTSAGVPTINCKKYCGLYESENNKLLNLKEMNNSLNVNVENVQKAFREAGNNPEIQTLLINLFGKDKVEVEQIDNRPITERIKTFEDACRELGNENYLVKAWQEIEETYVNCPDYIAYLKLRIIAAALNEGWTPKFTEDEDRWYPWFRLYTQKEVDEMSEEDKIPVSWHSGLANGSVDDVCLGLGYGYWLAFKTWKLAEYAGRQFIDIYADFCFKAE